MSFEKRLEFFLGYIVGQVAYIHFCIHYVFLFFIFIWAIPLLLCS
jgi:hypothetical protein